MCSLIKNYRLIILSLLSCSIFVLLVTCTKQGKEFNTLFETIAAIDFSNVETPVIEKINKLLEETKSHSDSATYWGRLGMNLYIHGFKAESLPVLKNAVALDNTDFRWTYFCAIALNDLNSADAIDWLERSRELKPYYPPLCITLGNRYLTSGDLPKAEELFNEAIFSWKNVPHAYVGLAKIAITKNDLDAADSLLNTALKITPAFREPHILLADVYRRKGEKANAESEINLIDQLPDKLDLKDPVYNEMVDEGVSSFWHQVRGDNYFKAGMLDKAVLEFKKVIEIKPHASFSNNLGNVYEKQKKYELAIEQYQSALKLDSVNIDALNNLGVVYFKIGDVDRAIASVKYSLELNPKSKDGYLNLGTFYKQLNQRSESMQYFKHGMELAPNDLRFAYQLSWLFSSAPEKELRNAKEALRLAKIIFNKADIDTPSKYDLVAAALAENGQFEKAIEMTNQAYKLAIKAGNHPQANDIYKRLNLYKNNKPYRESL